MTIDMQMKVNADNLTARLTERLTPTHLVVLDESASPFFTSKSRVACHRLVYDAVQDFIDQGLHALAIEVVKTT
jgi:BolA family transcriptional regulator, general stress-responsive regulator